MICAMQSYKEPAILQGDTLVSAGRLTRGPWVQAATRLSLRFPLGKEWIRQMIWKVPVNS